VASVAFKKEHLYADLYRKRHHLLLILTDIEIDVGHNTERGWERDLYESPRCGIRAEKVAQFKDGDSLVRVAARRSGSRRISRSRFYPGRITDGAESRSDEMALTRDFKETIRERVRREPAFRRALLRESIEAFFTGDVETGKAIVRNYINATTGFTQLEAAVHIPAKSLMRMLGPKGNPTAANIFDILAHLQKQEGVHFQVRPVRNP